MKSNEKQGSYRKGLTGRDEPSSYHVRNYLIFPLFLLSTMILTGCKKKPDVALCGRYYNNIVKIQQGGHPALLSATRTAGGKKAIIDHCLQLTQNKVKCSIKSVTINESMTCETMEEKSLLNDYFKLGEKK